MPRASRPYRLGVRRRGDIIELPPIELPATTLLGWWRGDLKSPWPADDRSHKMQRTLSTYAFARVVELPS
jgi:hypothetical protein